MVEQLKKDIDEDRNAFVTVEDDFEHRADFRAHDFLRVEITLRCSS